ncbi:uPF0348 protein Thebr_1326 [Clostridium sp. CAG:575]|nr:uPF0348 protein Thebr_1326 [Clostridium sp. CAG:575]
MSKVLGVIAEYNPFHNGHLYHLQKSKELTNADYTIAIISGNFTQRGSTSVIDKWAKTQMSLNNGIDLVIELPVLYSISSAENFADGAIKILSSLGIVDYLSFGSETSDIHLLNDISNILCDEPKDFKIALSEELKSGLSFPKARENALIKWFQLKDNISSSKLKNNNSTIRDILSSPNNILGIEYLKALHKYNSSIKPVCISRYEADYNSTTITNNIASATAIRNLILSKDYNTIKNLIPTSSYSTLTNCLNEGHIVPSLSCFEKEIIYVLRKMDIEEIANLPDVSEGLEYTIKKATNSCNTLSELINLVKSKRYTSTRIQRILLYALLGITKDDMEMSKNVLPYVRVLGFNENGKFLLSEISAKNPDIALITSVKKFVDSNSDKVLLNMFDKDVFATDVYSIAFDNNSFGNLDFTNKIVKI